MHRAFVITSPYHDEVRDGSGVATGIETSIASGED